MRTGRLLSLYGSSFFSLLIVVHCWWNVEVVDCLLPVRSHQRAMKYLRCGNILLRNSRLTLARRIHPPLRQVQRPFERSSLYNWASRLHSTSSTHPSLVSAETMAEEKEASISQHSEYEFWVRRLYRTNLFHPVKLGLTNIEKLHELLGHPMDKTIVVHIAGTNGKGSVALKIAKTLELSNPSLRVGLFCSPHISSFRERMQVNGSLITEKEVAEYLPTIYKHCRDHDIPATFFEITTALAFHFYDTRGCDVVVLETGLGGRLDATNVVKAPTLTIITSIGLEHTRILGDTIEKIALEKGGIVKPGRPLLVGPNVPHDVLQKCVKDKLAGPYYTVDDILGRPVGLTNVEMEDYDVENSRIATAAIKLLQQSLGHRLGAVSDEIIRKGTSERPPCRFEYVERKDGVQVILDVAHNPPAMDYLVRKLKATHPYQKVRVVVGMSSDKDLGLCANSILAAVDGDPTQIHLVEAANSRASKLEDMLEQPVLQGSHYDIDNRSVTPQIEKALKLARERQELVVICGSVFLMAEAREALDFDEPRDSPYIAEVAGAGARHSQENFGNSSSALPN